MAFMTLNGLTIPTASGGEREPLEIGTRERSFDGTLLRDRRALLRRWRFTTPPLQQAEAAMVRAIIQGRGHLFPFDSDLYSIGGLAPSASGNNAYRSNTAADGNPVELLHTIPSTTAPAAARTAAGAFDKASTNLLTADERDAENDPATDYTAMGGGALANDTTHFWQGLQSAKVTTSGIGDGLSVPGTAVAGATKYTGSVYIFVQSGLQTIRFRLVDDQNDKTTIEFDPPAVDTWYRVWLTHTTHAAATSLDMEISGREAVATVFNLDGFQLEQSGCVTTWVDGARAAISIADYPPSALAGINGGVTLACWANGSDIPAADSNYAFLIDLAADTAVAAAGENRISIFYRSSDGKPVTEMYGASGSATIVGASTHSHGPWHHYVATYSPALNTLYFYIDGALRGSASPAAAPDFSDLSAGGFSFGDSANTTSQPAGSRIDDAMVLPYYCTADMITALYGSGTAPAINLQRMTMGGDCISEDAISVIGTVRREMYVGVQRSGSWESNNVRLDIELEEAAA